MASAVHGFPIEKALTSALETSTRKY